MALSIRLRMTYGSMALFITILNNVFLLYYVEMFVSVYKIDRTSFWIGEAVFLLWNSMNDPLFGWLSDHKAVGDIQSGLSPQKVVQKRFRALMKYGPLFAVVFLGFWFQWATPAIQFVVCLCLYDGFLTLVDLNHTALLADLALSAEERTRLNAYCSAFSVLGSVSVFLSYSFWDRQNIKSFQIFCSALAIFSLVGFTVSSTGLKKHFATRKLKDDTPIDEVKSFDVVSTAPPASVTTQNLELKEYIHQLMRHKNFLWFAAMNFLQVFHCHFNSNFFPLFLDKLLADVISPSTGAILLGLSFVAPHINNLYFLTLCRNYGVYRVINWLFYVKLTLSVVMLTFGPNFPLLMCLFIASNRVFTEGTCKLLNLIISDLVDEDFVLHKRRQTISALVFGTSALLSKPGQTLAPLVGTWLLAEQTGHSLFYSDTVGTESGTEAANFHTSADQTLRWGCFYVLVYVPIAVAVIQIIVWSRFDLHGSKLQRVKHMRLNRGFSSAEV